MPNHTFALWINGATGRAMLIGDDGLVLHNIHGEHLCLDRHCVIHNPSEHHMRDWPLHWCNDRGIFERICPHGFGHPDPDQRLRVPSVHDCDGCCHEVA